MTKTEKEIMREFVLAMRPNIAQFDSYENDLAETRLYNKARKLVGLPPIAEPVDESGESSSSAFWGE